jgi:hypothetical protein
LHAERTEARPSGRIVLLAVVFEGGCAVVALAVGWLVGHWPWTGMAAADGTAMAYAEACVWGVLATIPMLLGLLVIEWIPWRIFRDVEDVIDRLVVPLFARCSAWQLAVVSLSAGVGEELLFRGLFQDGLARWLGPPHGVWVALLVASLAFGLCHYLTAGYAILATLIGVYLGGLLIWTDNLLTPVVAHGLYDFCALIYLVRRGAQHAAPADSDTAGEDFEATDAWLP